MFKRGLNFAFIFSVILLMIILTSVVSAVPKCVVLYVENGEAIGIKGPCDANANPQTNSVCDLNTKTCSDGSDCSSDSDCSSSSWSSTESSSPTETPITQASASETPTLGMPSYRKFEFNPGKFTNLNTPYETVLTGYSSSVCDDIERYNEEMPVNEVTKCGEITEPGVWVVTKNLTQTELDKPCLYIKSPSKGRAGDGQGIILDVAGNLIMGSGSITATSEVSGWTWFDPTSWFGSKETITSPLEDALKEEFNIQSMTFNSNDITENAVGILIEGDNVEVKNADVRSFLTGINVKGNYNCIRDSIAQMNKEGIVKRGNFVSNEFIHVDADYNAFGGFTIEGKGTLTEGKEVELSYPGNSEISAKAYIEGFKKCTADIETMNYVKYARPNYLGFPNEYKEVADYQIYANFYTAGYHACEEVSNYGEEVPTQIEFSGCDNNNGAPLCKRKVRDPSPADKFCFSDIQSPFETFSILCAAPSRLNVDPTNDIYREINVIGNGKDGFAIKWVSGDKIENVNALKNIDVGFIMGSSKNQKVENLESDENNLGGIIFGDIEDAQMKNIQALNNKGGVCGGISFSDSYKVAIEGITPGLSASGNKNGVCGRESAFSWVHSQVEGNSEKDWDFDSKTFASVKKFLPSGEYYLSDGTLQVI